MDDKNASDETSTDENATDTLSNNIPSSNNSPADGQTASVAKFEGLNGNAENGSICEDLKTARESTDDEDGNFCYPSVEEAKEQVEQVAKKIWNEWKGTRFHLLPEWLQDNEFLHDSHRPQLPSVSACIASIFRLHSETGNIWSHMLGCLIFLCVAVYVLTRPSQEVNWEDKFVFLPFLIGAIACMGLSFAFHTMYCHSKEIGHFFLKLDYVGISLLITGSFIPWLYYGFYCRVEPKIFYITLICVLGIACMIISFCEKFSLPSYRPVRAGVFILFGTAGVIPASHYFITDGFWSAFYEASFGWLLITVLIYLCGAILYAFRIPERFFPGKCDIWFQSHQLFHLLVIVAAFINYRGISELASWRGSGNSCEEKLSSLFDPNSLRQHLKEL